MSRIITDISHWQGLVNFQKMKDAGASAVIFKASQYYEDKNYKANVAAVKGILPYAAYHYYDNDIDPNKQAHKFASTLDGTEKFIIADYEDRLAGSHSGWNKLYTFLVRLQELVPNKKIVIYAGSYYWKENSPQRIWQKSNLEWFGQFKYWYAAYNTRSWLDQPIPKPWTHEDTLMWQYTDKGDGEKYGVSSIDVDLNYWTGTEEGFIEYFGEEEPEPPTPPTEPTEPPTGDDMIDAVLEVAKQIGRVADAIEGLSISVPQPPSDDDDQTDDEPVDPNAHNWIVTPKDDDNKNWPVYRTATTEDGRKRIVHPQNGIVVRSATPPKKIYNTSIWDTAEELRKFLRNWVWLPRQDIFDSEGDERQLPFGWPDKTGKPDEHWQGCFSEIIGLKGDKYLTKV